MANDVVLRFNVSHQQAGRTLTPWVELSSTGTFSETCGAAVPGVTFSGAAVSAPLASTNYPATVEVTGLAAGTTWYWRACTVDDLGVEGDWAARGGAPDFRTNAAPTATPSSPAADQWIGTDEATFVAQHGDADAHTGRIRFEVCTTNAADPWSGTCGSSYQRWDSAAGIANAGSASYSPVRPLPEGDTYWRVRSTDSLGTTGAWSARRVRVDLTAPSVPSSVALVSRGTGRMTITWSTSTDAGSGGITYDVEYSTDGTTFSATCTDIALLTCSRTGLASRTAGVMRVRACDAVDNCSAWQARAATSAGVYHLRSSLNSAQLTSGNNRRATLTSGTDNAGTSIAHGATTGWFPLRPAVAGSTTTVGAGEPANTPYSAPAGTGWVVDDTTGRVIPAGDIELRLTVDSSSGTGTGDIQCRAYRVVASAGSITSSIFLGKSTVGADVLSGTSGTVRTCTAATLASQVQLAANESIYVEAWLQVTVAGPAGATLAVHVEGTQSWVAVPPPGVAPSVPVQVAPGNAASTTSQPTLQATYDHPTPENGFLEFELATSAGFGATTVQAGTSSVRADNQDGTLATGPLTWATTYHWRVRAIGVSGATSGWSATRTFTVTSSPSRPSNVTPADGGTSTSLTPTLTSSAFADPDVADTHQASQWQVVAEGAAWSSPLADSGTSPAALTSWTTPTLTQGSTYAWRVRHRDSQGHWSAWSVPTVFTADAASLTIAVDRPTITTPGVFAQSNHFETFVVDVGTSNASGYQLRALGTASGSLGATCGGCAVPFPDWTGTDANPAPWTNASDGYIGVTVRDALGGRLAKWGPGTNTAETDIVANEYAGLGSVTPIVLHDRASAVASDDVVVTLRIRPSATTSPGTHSETIALTAVANP